MNKKTHGSIKRYFKEQAKIVEAFAKKQGLADIEYSRQTWWFNQSELFFSLDDIIYDLYNNVKKGMIIDWYYNSLEAIENEKWYPNYHNYVRYFQGLKTNSIEFDKIVETIKNE